MTAIQEVVTHHLYTPSRGHIPTPLQVQHGHGIYQTCTDLGSKVIWKCVCGHFQFNFIFSIIARETSSRWISKVRVVHRLPHVPTHALYYRNKTVNAPGQATFSQPWYVLAQSAAGALHCTLNFTCSEIWGEWKWWISSVEWMEWVFQRSQDVIYCHRWASSEAVRGSCF